MFLALLFYEKQRSPRWTTLLPLLFSAAAGRWAAVFHEPEEIPFATEAGLCTLCELPKHLWIIVPAEDASHVKIASFVIDDERINLMAQAFL